MNSKIKELGIRVNAALTLAAFACLMAPGAALAKVGGSSVQSNDLTKIADNSETLFHQLGNQIGAILVAVAVLAGIMTRNWRAFGGIFAAAILAKFAIDGGWWDVAGSVGDSVTKGLGG